MIKIKLISKKDTANYKAGQIVRIVEVEIDFNYKSITNYYDIEVEPIIITI